MEELEALDKKAIEQQYIASYHYSTFHKALGCILTLLILAVVIVAGSYLCVGIINLIVR
jgi:hypothetical protein